MKREKENAMKKFNKSKSKSPRGLGRSFLDEVPEKGTSKMIQETDQVPAWYKTLKR